MSNMAGAGDACAAGILDGNQLAPGIVNVAADDVSLVVIDAGDIALQVAQIVIIRAVVQLEAAHAACVVGEAQRVCAVGLLYQRTAHIGVFRCGASRNFLGAQAAFVVLIADVETVARDSRHQLERWILLLQLNLWCGSIDTFTKRNTQTLQ